jgi:hypothetical protein
MSTEARTNHRFTTSLRALFALVAVTTLISNSPWTQADQLTAITAYAGSLMWGVMAAFGNKPGWQRDLTMAIALVYLILVVSKITGFAA